MFAHAATVTLAAPTLIFAPSLDEFTGRAG